MRILIVADEQIIAVDLRRRLKRMGHVGVGIVTSGEEAIVEAQRLQPDLVLMDVRLRGSMDGIEAAQQIRAQFGIPMILMSAYTTVQSLEHIWRMVPTVYLSKPFFEDQFRVALEKVLETQWWARPESHCP
jgi:CheY-like chemotaxis protein